MKIAVCRIAQSRYAQTFPKLCQTSGKLQLTGMLHSPRKWTQFGIVIVLLCQAAWQFDDAPHFMQRETSSDDDASLVNQIHTHAAFLSWLYWPNSQMPTCCLRGRDANPNNLHIRFTTVVVTCIVSQILCRMKHKCLHKLKTEHADYLNSHNKCINNLCRQACQHKVLAPAPQCRIVKRKYVQGHSSSQVKSKSLKGSSSERHRLVHLLQREKGPTTKTNNHFNKTP
jgi:hypothetical protein